MRRTEWLQETRKMRFEEKYTKAVKVVVLRKQKRLCYLVYVIVHFGVIWASMTKAGWMR
ncbi:MAG: hypothetical protein NPIRA05_20900 [Nitrospirales bacterium]|nr:MAG: hypothetical protein NPIRA05_20900 [Nitrospirales bacterium]